MRMKFLVHTGLLAVLASPAPLSAQSQSLADVARAEEARRKTVKTPSKTYTNADLNGGGAPTSPPAPPAAVPPSGAAADKPETKKPDAADAGPKKDEKYWKDRQTALLQQQTRNKVLLDALQSRVNALSTDFVNTDDPGQRAIVETNRKTALAEMDRVTKENDKITKALADLSEEARKASVPPGWLR